MGTEKKEREELYVYSPCGRSSPVKGELYVCQFTGYSRFPDNKVTDKQFLLYQAVM
jgi:hypothetical protein